MALPALIANRLSVPVVAAPLFIISNPDLVIAQCKAGVVGSFPSLNARPLEVLDAWLERITGELAAHDAMRSDSRSTSAYVYALPPSTAWMSASLGPCLRTVSAQ